MQVFISSPIRGLEAFREAAARAALALGHKVVRAEDFGATAESPQRTCLAGVREADVVVLLLGARYGIAQGSGLSATDEEYREARERCPILAFVQEGVEPEPRQEEFLSEVREWGTGHHTEAFSTPDDLRDQVTRRLHELELSRVAGVPDEEDMVSRVLSMIPAARQMASPSLVVVLSGGPRQSVLRPSELEDPELRRELMREALFGEVPVLDHEQGSAPRLSGSALLIEQSDASVLLDELGTIRVVQPARERGPRSHVELPALMEDVVRFRIERALRFGGWLLDRIDPLRRLSDVLPLVAVQSAGYLPWRSRAEHETSPQSGTVGRGSDSVVVRLVPARRARAALRLQADALAEDLTVLLRRELRGNG